MPRRRFLTLNLLIVFLIGAASLLTLAGTPTPAYAHPSAQAPACGPQWALVPSPDGGSAESRLTSVAALAPNDVWAVGYTTPSGLYANETLAMHWDGTAWTITPTPDTLTHHERLRQVAAWASDDVWALNEGWPQALLHWDGSVWSHLPISESIEGPLADIAPIGPNQLWAVGTLPGFPDETLVAQWDGSAWSRIPSPNVPGTEPGTAYPSRLNAIEVLAPDNIWAVGDYSPDVYETATLIQHWDGTAWHIVPSPNGASGFGKLTAISAATPNDIWAVGSYANAYGSRLVALHWDGTRWTSFPVPEPSPHGSTTLTSVVALAPNNAWAVGDWFNAAMGNSTFVMHWDGIRWRHILSPNALGATTGWNILSDVAALSPTEIWAVGTGQTAFGEPSVPLTLRYADPCPGTAALASLTLDTPRLLGSETSQGVVTLNTPAPAGGAVVTLTSAQPQVVTLPETVTIPQGARRATFPVSTHPVAVRTDAVITATWAGSQQVGVQVVEPAMLVAIQVSPGYVVGGMVTQGQITLSGPAPANAVVELVTSAFDIIALPPTITVPAGAAQVTFPITTSMPAERIADTISATYNGRTRDAVLHISPDHAVHSIDPWMLGAVGGHPTEGTVVLTAPAPIGGALVSLESTQPDFAMVPPSVLVPAGQITATFPITTQPVPPPGNVQVFIHATWNSAVAEALMYVWPLEISGLTVAQSTVQGGSPTHGEVTLNAPALAGGTVITLGSDSTSITVPLTVTVPAGALMATFPIATAPLSETESAAVYANYAGYGGAEAYLELVPDPTATIVIEEGDVIGGAFVSGSVTLSSPAPAGGTTVELMSLRPTLAGVPPHVHIPAGATTMSFSIQSAPVVSTTTAPLTVNRGGILNTTALTIHPGLAATPLLSHSQVVGGTPVSLTITLSASAPAGGATITLNSTNTDVVTVPASVVIPEGQLSTHVALSTTLVAHEVAVILAATYDTISQTTTLGVMPPAAPCHDWSGDGSISIDELVLVADHWGETLQSPLWDQRLDLDGNEMINMVDITRLTALWGTSCP